MKKIIAVAKYEAAGRLKALNQDALSYFLGFFDINMLVETSACCRLLQESVQKTPGYKMFRFLIQLGMIYPVKFSDGRETIACIVTYEGIKRILGVRDAEGLREIFQGCGGKEDFNEDTDVNEHGILVNLDFYQQAALLRAICARIPGELARKTGFYNLRGSRKVYEVLNRAKVHNTKSIYWFYAGEKYIAGLKETEYSEEGLVRGSDIGAIKGSRFCYRILDYDIWDSGDPDDCNDGRAMVVGGFI